MEKTEYISAVKQVWRSVSGLNLGIFLSSDNDGILSLLNDLTEKYQKLLTASLTLNGEYSIEELEQIVNARNTLRKVPGRISEVRAVLSNRSTH